MEDSRITRLSSEVADEEEEDEEEDEEEEEEDEEAGPAFSSHSW